MARWDWHVREGGAILVSCDASARLPAAAAAPILLPDRADEAILWPARSRVRVAADLGAQVVIMGEDGRDLVIKLDERGVELLRSWARPCTEFRVTMPPDGSIVLHPMSGHDAELWRSGLVGQIVQNFSHPDWMIRIKPDKL